MKESNQQDWSRTDDSDQIFIFVGMVVFIVCLWLFGTFDTTDSTTLIEEDRAYALTIDR